MILICFSENSGKAGKSVDRNFGIFDKIVCSRLGGEYISTGWKSQQRHADIPHRLFSSFWSVRHPKQQWMGTFRYCLVSFKYRLL